MNNNNTIDVLLSSFLLGALLDLKEYSPLRMLGRSPSLPNSGPPHLERTQTSRLANPNFFRRSVIGYSEQIHGQLLYDSPILATHDYSVIIAQPREQPIPIGEQDTRESENEDVKRYKRHMLGLDLFMHFLKTRVSQLYSFPKTNI